MRFTDEQILSDENIQLKIAKYSVERFLRTKPAVLRNYFDDLVQEAWMALSKCLPAFEPERGFRVTTFVVRRMWGACHDYLRKLDFAPHTQRAQQVKNPDHFVPKMKNISDVATDRIERNPLKRNTERQFSDFLDSLGNYKQEDDFIQSEQFWEEVCKTLSPNEERIVLRYYRDDFMMREVADELSLSESRISQMVQVIHAKLAARKEPLLYAFA